MFSSPLFDNAESQDTPLLQASGPVEPESDQELTIEVSKNGLDPKILEIVELFKKRNFLDALRLAEKIAKDANADQKLKKWVNEQLPTLYLAVGYEFLKANDCPKAINYLQASNERKESGQALRGLTFCYYRGGRSELAKRSIDRSVRLKYFDLDMLKIHRELMETSQNLEETVDYFEQAIEHMRSLNEQEKVDLFKEHLDKIRKKLSEQTRQDSFISNNFYIKYRPSLGERTALTILDFLEESLLSYTERYLFNMPPKQIEVVLYPQESFLSTNENAPVWAEGLYDGRLKIPYRPNSSLIPEGRFANVLKHELVHALVDILKRKRKLATWLEEGLAQYLACFGNCLTVEPRGSATSFLSEADLEGPFTRLRRDKAVNAYRQSLYLIYVLKIEYDSEAVRRIIETLNREQFNSSDDILNKSVNQPFSVVYKKARLLWNQKRPLLAD